MDRVRLKRLQASAQAAGLTAAMTHRGGAVAFRRGNTVLIVKKNHAFTHPDIITEFDIYFSAVRPVQNGTDQVVDYSTPAWHHLSGSGEDFFFTSVTEGESINPMYLDAARLKEGDVVFDLGANCGLATLAFSRAVGPAGRVISLEPDPQNFDSLSRNVERHGLANVTALQEGAWDKSTTIRFASDGSMGSYIVEIKAGDWLGDGTTIKVASLGDLAARMNLQRVDFVKMDVEGSEHKVVPTLGPFLARYRPALMIEVHGEGMDKSQAFMEAQDYSATPVVQSPEHAFPLLLCRPR